MQFTPMKKVMASVASLCALAAVTLPTVAGAAKPTPTYDPCLDIVSGQTAGWTEDLMESTFSDGRSITNHLQVTVAVNTADGCSSPSAASYQLKWKQPQASLWHTATPSSVAVVDGHGLITFTLDQGSIVSRTTITRDLFGRTTESSPTVVDTSGFVGNSLVVYVLTTNASGAITDAAPSTVDSETTPQPFGLCRLEPEDHCDDGGGQLTFLK